MKIQIFKLTFLVVILNFVFSLSTFAQGDRKLKINEILVFNETNYVDDYGNHSSWIEVFNPAYNPVDISKMYLTNDKNNPRKYRIPDAGNLTVLQPRSFAVFFADNKPTRGIFHVNFLLDSSGYIAIYDSDGRTLLDELYYPLQKADITYGRIEDGTDGFQFLDVSTPNSSNVTTIKPAGSEVFIQIDPTGLGLSFIAMFIVFLVLIIMYFMLRILGNLLNNKINVKIKVPGKSKNVIHEEEVNVVMLAEVNAVIAAALHLYTVQAHDIENTNINIKKISKPYSPWSSKIYSLRAIPRK